MSELIAKALAYLRGMWRFRWSALIVAWLVSMAGWVWTFTLPNQYESSTQVYVDTDSALRDHLDGLAPTTNVMSEVQIMTRTLLARPNLLSVAEETDLDLRATTPREKERLIDSLRARISISRSRGNDRLFTISFVDPNPNTARDVVQTLLNSFVGDSLRRGRNSNTEAMRFLQAQIDEHERRLLESEDRLADFKKRNHDKMPDAAGDYYARLQAGNSQLKALESELRLKRSTRDELESQIEGETPTFGIMKTPGTGVDRTSTLDPKIRQAEAQLEQLRLQYTDRHPDVIAASERLSTLQQQRQQDMANLPVPELNSGAGNALDMNPVYSNLRIALSRVDVEIVELESRARQQRAIVGELRRNVDTVPEIEAELTRLNRDYAITKSNYENFVRRMERARIGEDANETVDDVQFEIVEPPSLPLEPIGPHRFAFIAITLFGGLGAGLVFAFLLDQIRPVFITKQDLASRTGLPVLGSVSVVMMPRQRMMMRLQTSVFALALLALLACFAVVGIFQGTFVAIAERVLGGG